MNVKSLDYCALVILTYSLANSSLCTLLWAVQLVLNEAAGENRCFLSVFPCLLKEQRVRVSKVFRFCFAQSRVRNLLFWPFGSS